MGIVLKRSLPALLIALVSCAPAAAHAAQQPRVEVKAPGNGLIRSMTVRLTDPDSGAPIDGAEVTAMATMTKPHFMSMPLLRFHPDGGGRYQTRVRFEMRAPWTMTMQVTRGDLAPLFTTFQIDANTANPGDGFRVVYPPASNGDGWILLGLVVSIAVALLGAITAVLLWRRQRREAKSATPAARIDDAIQRT
jgi:hypothetical protein